MSVSVTASGVRTRSRVAKVASLLLLASVGSLLWTCSEASRAIFYAPIYLIALAPGLPLGFALFGRRHAAGWVSGALLGYALTATACSIAIRLGAHSAVGIVVAWGVLLISALGATVLGLRPIDRLRVGVSTV